MGYFLYASNTAKRCIEVLHRLGLSISYETVISALRRNGEASLKQLRKEIQHRRFFVSFDNMNFFQNVRDQRMHNHARQVNYTAGYVCIMECCGKQQCECGSLAAESIDRKAALALSFRDFDLADDRTDHYFQEAAAYLIGTALSRHFKKPAAQAIDRAPLSEIKAKPGRTKIFCMRTFDEDEASIAGTISILKLINEELGLAVGDGGTDDVDLRDKVVMYHGDYLTVRNIRYVSSTIHARKESLGYY